MEDSVKKKQNTLLGKILVAFVIVSTIVALYLTVKLVIAGFTFR